MTATAPSAASPSLIATTASLRVAPLQACSRQAGSPQADSWQADLRQTASAPTDARQADSLRADLDTALRYALAIGTLLVLMLPAARGSHGAIGWLPMWLVAMPAMAWWALHRFRLPAWRRAEVAQTVPALRRRRGGAVQARRRARPAVIPQPLPRVA